MFRWVSTFWDFSDGPSRGFHVGVAPDTLAKRDVLERGEEDLEDFEFTV